MSGGETNTRAKKTAYFGRLQSLFDSYTKILLVSTDHVGSHHLQMIRNSLRGRAVIMMGKNSLIRKAIEMHLDKIPALETLLPHIWGNVGLVFTKDDASEICQELVKNTVQKPAKTGSVSPVDVIVPAGSTGQEPTKTSFFQALSISTVIRRNAIEILNNVRLIKAGDKVTPSQSALLQMLDIKPFQYGLGVTVVYEDGVVYDAELLKRTDEDVLNSLRHSLTNVAALSLKIGHPTVASVPYSVINAFANLIAISLQTDYAFPAGERVKEMLADPSRFTPTDGDPEENSDVEKDPDDPIGNLFEITSEEDPDDPIGNLFEITSEEPDDPIGNLFGEEEEGMGSLFGAED